MNIYNLFLNNKYTKWYTSIIQHRKDVPYNGYTERHHIIPKCYVENNNKENLVRLSAREHFICHWLLTKMTDNLSLQRKFTYALNRMTCANEKHERNYISRYYEIARKKHSEMMSGKNNPMYGSKRIVSEETREKLSKSSKGRIFTEETKLKISSSKKGKSRSLEARKSISLARLQSKNEKIRGPKHPNFGKKHSEESLEKMRNVKIGKNNPMYNKNHSEESKKKISEGKKIPHKIVICPHCNKEGGWNNMKRYHMENCKYIIPS
jgi:hypothetical protein